MQPSSEHQEHQEKPSIDAGPQPDVGTEGQAVHGPAASDDDASGPEASCSEPPEVFPLDYDRELTYLEREGKLRGGRRPTGFKK